MVDLKFLTKRYQGNDKVCSISSLDSSTIDGGVKATVYGIVRAIAITSESVVALCETGI